MTILPPPGNGSGDKTDTAPVNDPVDSPETPDDYSVDEPSTPSTDAPASEPDIDASDEESPAGGKTDISEPVITESDTAQTYGNMTRVIVAPKATVTYPEYPTGNLVDINWSNPRPYPTENSLSYQEFMECLGHYAQFETYAYYGSDCEQYAKYAEYATYLLLQSFAKEFKLSSLESACENMLEQLSTSPDGAAFTLNHETLRQECEFYNSDVMESVKASKSGYSLTAFRALQSDTYYTDSDSQPYNAHLLYNKTDPYSGPEFCLCYLPLAPVFQPVKTWYGKVSELTIGQHLRAGSLVYAECTGTDDQNRCARFFIKTGYNGSDGNAAHFIDEKAFIDEPFQSQPFDYNDLATWTGSTAITRVPSQYTPAPGEDTQNVACWKIKSIISPSSDSPSSGDRHPFYNTYDWYWHGDAYPDSGSAPIKVSDLMSSQYIFSNHVMVELEPCDEVFIDVPTPQIGLENINLQLEKDGDPTSTGSSIDPLTDDNYYLTYYVEPQSSSDAGGTADDSSAVSWDDTKAERYSGTWTEKERLLYPGGWRVYCKAVYRHTDGTLYDSDIAVKDIHITEPQLTAPTIAINGLTASYTGPSSITAKPAGDIGDALSNSADSYAPYVSDQKLIRKTTQTETDTAQNLSLPAGSLEDAASFDAQDTLAAGYNKIFAYTVLTLPDSSRIVSSVPAKPDRSYYSDSATQVKTVEQATVSFDTQGGSFNPNGSRYQETGNTIPVGSPYGVNGRLPLASKDHYTFDGWYTAADGGDEITAASTVETAGSHTLYARYTDHTYTIIFNANGGTGSMADMTGLPYHGSRNLTRNTFTKSDSQGKFTFTFAGWSTTAAEDNAAVQWRDGASVTGADFQDKIQWDSDTPEEGTVTLYAVWTKTVNKATVSFDTQGGSFNHNGTEYQENNNHIPVGDAYGKNGRLPLASKYHYTFDGWYTEADGGTEITAASTVGTAEPHTLYAHYTEHTYTISFDANGGTGNIAPMADIPYSSSKELTGNTFTRTDSQGKSTFTFAG